MFYFYRMSGNDALAAQFWDHAFGKVQSHDKNITQMFEVRTLYLKDAGEFGDKQPLAGNELAGTPAGESEIDAIARMMVNF